MRLVAAIGEGHTWIESHGPVASRWYPIRLYEFTDGIFVTSAHRSVRDLVGVQILEVAGLPVAGALSQARELLGADNRFGALENLHAISSAGLMRGLGLAEPSGALRLRIKDQKGGAVSRSRPWRVARLSTGNPAARDRLLGSALDAEANLVVLSGDSHNAWAFDLDLGGTAAGVEFAGHSVTSPGYEGHLPGVHPNDVARAIVAHNRQLKWADTSRRGYMTLELTREQATGEWLFLDTVRHRSTAIAARHRMSAARGANRLSR